jgi:large subunit ribosomal protein L9
MKVILISKVANFGNIGDIVNVKNGFARNFLIPQKKAMSYSVANYKFFEERKRQFELENEENATNAGKIRDKLLGKDIIIIENASDDGRLYGSVSTSVIASKINDMLGEKTVSCSHILLKKPIKEIGLYNISINMHSDVSSEIRLIVTRNESEIQNLLNKKDSQKDSEEVSEAA